MDIDGEKNRKGEADDQEDSGSSDDESSDDESESSDDESERVTTGSIAVEAFSCHACAKLLGPPIFECPGGHFFCKSCRDDQLPEEKCKFCSGCPVALSHGMNRAVKSIFLDCSHAKHGCTHKIPLYEESPRKHEVFCPHAPCKCPEHGCSFAVTAAAELLDHLTGQHKWPSVTFQYWVPFDLRVVQPGAHVLHCKNDGELFLLSVQPAVEPPGLVVSLVSVRHKMKHDDDLAAGCSVSFKCSERHHGTSTLDELWPWSHFGWPPKEYMCFVPKVLDGTDDGIVLTINIVSPDAAGERGDPDDDSSFYVESDEDSGDTSSS